MIQTFTVTAPLGQADPDAAVATLEGATEKLVRLYPHFRSAAVEASEGVLTVTLRVAAVDRWRCSAVARKIGTNMLLRAGIDVATGAIELVRTAPAATTLTKERGRNMTGHRPRGPAQRSGEG